MGKSTNQAKDEKGLHGYVKKFVEANAAACEEIGFDKDFTSVKNSAQPRTYLNKMQNVNIPELLNDFHNHNPVATIKVLACLLYGASVITEAGKRDQDLLSRCKETFCEILQQIEKNDGYRRFCELILLKESKDYSPTAALRRYGSSLGLHEYLCHVNLVVQSKLNRQVDLTTIDPIFYAKCLNVERCSSIHTIKNLSLDNLSQRIKQSEEYVNYANGDSQIYDIIDDGNAADIQNETPQSGVSVKPEQCHLITDVAQGPSLAEAKPIAPITSDGRKVQQLVKPNETASSQVLDSALERCNSMSDIRTTVEIIQDTLLKSLVGKYRSSSTNDYSHSLDIESNMWFTDMLVLLCAQTGENEWSENIATKLHGLGYETISESTRSSIHTFFDVNDLLTCRQIFLQDPYPGDVVLFRARGDTTISFDDSICGRIRSVLGGIMMSYNTKIDFFRRSNAIRYGLLKIWEICEACSDIPKNDVSIPEFCLRGLQYSAVASRSMTLDYDRCLSEKILQFCKSRIRDAFAERRFPIGLHSLMSSLTQVRVEGILTQIGEETYDLVDYIMAMQRHEVQYNNVSDNFLVKGPCPAPMDTDNAVTPWLVQLLMTKIESAIFSSNSIHEGISIPALSSKYGAMAAVYVLADYTRRLRTAEVMNLYSDIATNRTGEVARAESHRLTSFDYAIVPSSRKEKFIRLPILCDDYDVLISVFTRNNRYMARVIQLGEKNSYFILDLINDVICCSDQKCASSVTGPGYIDKCRMSLAYQLAGKHVDHPIYNPALIELATSHKNISGRMTPLGSDDLKKCYNAGNPVHRMNSDHIGIFNLVTDFITRGKDMVYYYTSGKMVINSNCIDTSMLITLVRGRELFEIIKDPQMSKPSGSNKLVKSETPVRNEHNASRMDTEMAGKSPDTEEKFVFNCNMSPYLGGSCYITENNSERLSKLLQVLDSKGSVRLDQFKKLDECAIKFHLLHNYEAIKRETVPWNGNMISEDTEKLHSSNSTITLPMPVAYGSLEDEEGKTPRSSGEPYTEHTNASKSEPDDKEPASLAADADIASEVADFFVVSTDTENLNTTLRKNALSTLIAMFTINDSDDSLRCSRAIATKMDGQTWELPVSTDTEGDCLLAVNVIPGVDQQFVDLLNELAVSEHPDKSSAVVLYYDDLVNNTEQNCELIKDILLKFFTFQKWSPMQLDVYTGMATPPIPKEEALVSSAVIHEDILLHYCKSATKLNISCLKVVPNYDDIAQVLGIINTAADTAESYKHSIPTSSGIFSYRYAQTKDAPIDDESQVHDSALTIGDSQPRMSTIDLDCEPESINIAKDYGNNDENVSPVQQSSANLRLQSSDLHGRSDVPVTAEIDAKMSINADDKHSVNLLKKCLRKTFRIKKENLA